MNKLIAFILSVCLFQSCVTTDKALTKIASETDFSPEQKSLLATIMAHLFPPEEYTTPGTIRADSAAFKTAIASLELQVDQARNDREQLSRLLEQSGGENEELLKIAAVANSRYDSLNTAFNIAKSGKIPCPDKLKTDTAYQESKAKLDACKIKATELEKQLAAKEVELAAADATIKSRDKKIEERETEINELKSKVDKEKWKWIKIGAISAAALLIGIGIFLKLKRFI